MALTARILNDNGRDNVECYAAGTNGNLPVGIVPCSQDGGRFLGLDWAIPCSDNGITISNFNYTMATNNTKPREDAVKVLTVEDLKYGGKYVRVIVPDDYTISSYVEACCAGCDPIPDVVVVAPQLFDGVCTLAAPTLPGCVYTGSFYLTPFTNGATAWTITPQGYDAAGTEIVFAPTTISAATPALVASGAQTAWAAEMGSGTFVANGNAIVWTATILATASFNQTQA